ncbi:MAG TPA: hypothetical protein VN880_20305 [Solirubrobacteraceae bacterium]|nr:hypothetical protein [Solirubrobacteraceae bacterium]
MPSYAHGSVFVTIGVRPRAAIWAKATALAQVRSVRKGFAKVRANGRLDLLDSRPVAAQGTVFTVMTDLMWLAERATVITREAHA